MVCGGMKDGLPSLTVKVRDLVEDCDEALCMSGEGRERGGEAPGILICKLACRFCDQFISLCQCFQACCLPSAHSGGDFTWLWT